MLDSKCSDDGVCRPGDTGDRSFQMAGVEGSWISRGVTVPLVQQLSSTDHDGDNAAFETAGVCGKK